MTQQRRAMMAELVQRDGSKRVSELADHFGVSEVTVRSDLVRLEREGHLIRDHGGAHPKSEVSFVSSLARLDERASFNLAQKRQIGEIAISCIEPGDTIILDAGTTTLEIARRLRLIRPLTVITNSLHAAMELGSTGDLRVILIGGTLNSESVSTVGPLAEEILSRFSVQKLFLGTQALDLDAGLTDSTLEIAQLKRAMIRAARQIILVTDSSKWGHTSLVKVASLSEIDTLVTDGNLPEGVRAATEKLGIKLLLA